jgi:solute carrier family 25 (mitochondrial carrier protein), member 16
VFFTYPLEVIRVRLAFETHHTGRTTLRTISSQIYHERDNTIRPSNSQSPSLPNTAPLKVPAPVREHFPLFGLTNFYRGFTPTIVGMIPYAGVSFWVHDWVGDILRSPAFAKFTLSPVDPRNEREARHPKLKGQWEAVAGGCASLLGQTSSYPIEVVRRRMQVGGAVGNREMRGLWQTVKSIYSSGGLRGFYVGLSIGYIKVCPSLLVVDFIGYSHGVCIFCGVGADETLVGLELEYRNVLDLGQVVCIIVRLLSLVR